MKKRIVTKTYRKYVKLTLIIVGMLFGFGYLLLLVNGYYHVKYIKILELERRDLIVRLGFLSHTIGILLYPTAIVVLGGIIWLRNKYEIKIFMKELFSCCLGLSITGILYYGNIELGILFKLKEGWIVGIILICISIRVLLKRKIMVKQHENSNN